MKTVGMAHLSWSRVFRCGDDKRLLFSFLSRRRRSDKAGTVKKEPSRALGITLLEQTEMEDPENDQSAATGTLRFQKSPRSNP